MKTLIDDAEAAWARSQKTNERDVEPRPRVPAGQRSEVNRFHWADHPGMGLRGEGEGEGDSPEVLREKLETLIRR